MMDGLPFGPMEEDLVFDHFTYERVKTTQCIGSISTNVCTHLLNSGDEDQRYLTICVPCYNESVDELMKTILSLMENVEFMQRKARLYEDMAGVALKHEFAQTTPVIVPIFDGVKAMSPSVQEWLQDNFPGALDNLARSDDGNGNNDTIGKEEEDQQQRGRRQATHEEVDVRIACSRWWYYCDDTLPSRLSDEDLSNSNSKKNQQNRDTNSAGSSKSNSNTGRKTSQNSADGDPFSFRSSYDSGGGGGGHAPTSASMNTGSSSYVDDIVSKLAPTRKINTADASLRLSLSRGHFSANIDEEHIIYFNIVPIVKRSNHRKHNSHQWFFDAICAGMDRKMDFCLLTDCGTTYSPTCVARLFYELRFKTDLIGVTARQRVETPGLFFHPCEDAPFACLRGNHTASGDMRPCWKCYASFYLSPCPLQGFEFEATLIMNSAMFNMVEALPVMPGPCQMLNWKKMKEFRVVEEYFNLLFKGESDKRIPSMPHRFKRMSANNSSFSSIGTSEGGSSAQSTPKYNMSPLVSTAAGSRDGDNAGTTVENNQQCTASSTNSSSSSSSSTPSTRRIGTGSGSGSGSYTHTSNGTTTHRSRNSGGPATPTTTMTFTEFLRVNMRLAEDRILSFVCVFSTGFGTKWIPGATFFYQPEVRWSSLLTQRRRWINGTFASFLFFFNSKRASDRIKGGMFDSYKAGKNVRWVNGLWALQLVQLVLVLIAPAVFASSSYVAVTSLATQWKDGFGWAKSIVFTDAANISGAEIWVTAFFIIYIIWTFLSYYADRGRMPELLCQCLAVYGFIFIFPIYLSVWWTIITDGLNIVDLLVIGSLVLPVLVALAQSVTSAALYLCYLPWFMFLLMFFLVFVPSYSFARLYDTTWGNRATGNDSALTDKMVDVMKTRNFLFICALMGANIAAAMAFIRIFRLGYSAVLGFMLVVFFPMIVQLVLAFVFLFLAVPLRYLAGDRTELASANPKHSAGGGGGGGNSNSDSSNGSGSGNGSGPNKQTTTASDSSSDSSSSSANPLHPIAAAARSAEATDPFHSGGVDIEHGKRKTKTTSFR